LAAKDNTSASQIDKTSFWWTGLCGICHPGGGPGEFDRDGELYHDAATGLFGYEKIGKIAADVTLDGDYCEVSSSTGALRPAPWDKTGVAEPDCLMCHRADRVVDAGKNMNWIWRAATLRRKDTLVDDADDPVKAFAAASTAGQGWFSNMEMATVPAGKPPMATRLQIDYQVGLDNGSLVENADGELMLAPASVSSQPKDEACWGCHTVADLKKRGRAWFDPAKDVHYAGFNKLNDVDPANDIPAGESRACVECHPSTMDHDFAKGNAFLGTVKDHKDYASFRTCRDCHDTASPVKHPDAPSPMSTIHTSGHLAAMSCEMCHIPYKLDAASFMVDNATTGATINYNSPSFYSADPLDPDDPDKSRWWPSFYTKADQDGVNRLFPVKRLLSAWWGDWDDRGTPELTDDVINPIPLWRVRQITGGAPLGIVTDDNADTKLEVNSKAEILAYIQALKANDSHGNPVAAVPVLVKGGQIWHENAGGTNVQSFEYHGTGIKAESSHPFSVNHNVLLPSEALGASSSCGACHKGMNGGADTSVFDRLILVDPFDELGNPIYKTVRELTGVDPF